MNSQCEHKDVQFQFLSFYWQMLFPVFMKSLINVSNALKQQLSWLLTFICISSPSTSKHGFYFFLVKWSCLLGQVCKISPFVLQGSENMYTAPHGNDIVSNCSPDSEWPFGGSRPSALPDQTWLHGVFWMTAFSHFMSLQTNLTLHGEDCCLLHLPTKIGRYCI